MSFTGIQLQSLVHVLSRAVSMLQQQSGVVATGIVLPLKSKLFTICYVHKKLANL